MTPPVTLQITVAPSDLPHAEPILSHQLRQWRGQVDEVVFTYDVVQGDTPTRFADGWDERRPGMDALLARLCEEFDAHVDPMDRGPEMRATIGDRFFGGEAPPFKDARGGPFYCYFWGLHRARHDVVFHIDSDLMFGGGDQGWVAEAVERMAAEPDVLACSPLPGPPRADGWVRATESARAGELPYPAYRFPYFSSRLWMLDRRRLEDRCVPLPLDRPPRLTHRLKARLHGHPPIALPEDLVSASMRRHGLSRLDLLGPGRGMWSLHPPYRSEAFYARLPELIDRVERGDVPDGQRGEYDVTDALFKWGAARRAHKRRRLVR